MSSPYEERVVWSPEHGGCLMIQRRYVAAGSSVARAVGPGWHDWTSACESEYPKRDALARRAVERANQNLRESARSAPHNPKTLRVSSKPQATSSNRSRRFMEPRELLRLYSNRVSRK